MKAITEEDRSEAPISNKSLELFKDKRKGVRDMFHHQILSLRLVL